MRAFAAGIIISKHSYFDNRISLENSPRIDLLLKMVFLGFFVKM